MPRTSFSTSRADSRASSPWNPGFTRFFLAQSVSWIGSSMTPVALSFGILRTTGDIGDLSLVLAANTVPMIALLLVGGVVADRLPRRALLTVTHALAGLTQAASAAWFLLGDLPLAALIAATALNGLASAFTAPALRGIVVDLVPPPARGRANAVRTASRNLTRMIGPAVSGVLVATAGAELALAIDAACLLLACALLATVPDAPAPGSTPSVPSGAAGPSAQRGRALRTVASELHGGWQEFLAHRWLWSSTMAFTGLNVLIGGIWLVLGPAMAAPSIGASGWGLVLGARAAGQVAGATLAYRWTPHRPLVGVLLLPLPYAAVFAAIAVDAGTVVLLALAALAGCGSAMSDVLWETTLQQHVAAGALSRVASLDMLISFVSVPAGQLAAPALALAVGAPAVVAAGSIVCVLVLVAPLVSADVRRLTPEPAPEQAQSTLG